MSSHTKARSQSSSFHSTRKPTKKELQEADDYHKMKDYYYDRYMSQLRDKILELDQPSSPLVQKSQSQHALNSVQKSNRSKKPHIKPVKTAIPKSNRLTMLEAEHRLTKAGFLKTDDELMEFRNGISTARDINQYAEDYMAMKSTEKNRLSASRKADRPLSKIAETRENTPGKSRPSSKGIPKKQMDTDLNPLSGNKKLSPADIARAAAAALEKRCPRMDVPDLHCLRPDSDDSDGESEIAREEGREKRKDEYSSHVAYLREMYQRAQANSAQTRRIIYSRDDDILQIDRKTKLISDLTDVCGLISPSAPSTAEKRKHRIEFYDAVSSTYDQSFDVPDLSDTDGDNLADIQEERVSQWRQETQQPLTVSRQPFNVFTPIEEEPSTPVLDRSSSPVHSLALVPHSTAETSRAPPTLAIEDSRPITANQPLTMNGVETEVKVIESKSMSTYWPNYLKAGESKFARNENDMQ